MGEYIVSARKYRPRTFDEVVGQESLTTTLKNAIRSGKLAHAYLFCGPRGVGKTTCARIFAKTINCLHPLANGEACNECESCRAFNEQRSFNIQELDAASNNSVEEIRQLIEQVRIPPQIGKYKVFIIDEVHMLSTAAFNAFLKTLEEPPQHVIFILATTEKHKILPTILSRCQIYDFNRMEIPVIVKHLEAVAKDQQIPYDAEALNVIARKADGGMRDALSIFDQVASFGNGKITYEDVIRDLNVLDYEYYFKVTEDILSHNVPDLLLIYNEILNKGFQGSQFIQGLAGHFRNLLVSKDQVTLPLLEVADSVKKRYRDVAVNLQSSYLYKAMKLCNDCDLNYRVSNNKRLLIELTLIQLEQAIGAGDALNPRPENRSISLKAIHKQEAVKNTETPSQKNKSATLTIADSPVISPKKSETQNIASQTSVHEPSPTYVTGRKAGSTKSIPTFKRSDNPLSVHLKSSDAPQNVADPRVSNSSPSSSVSVSVASGGRTVQSASVKDKVVTESELSRYWLEYAQLLPTTERAVSERMKIIQPKLEDATHISIEVENENVKNHLKKFIPQILDYLKKHLENDALQLVINIHKGEALSLPATPQQYFMAMGKKNPNLLKMKEMFGLDIR